MFTEWPCIEPEQDNPLLQVAEHNLIEFLRSIPAKQGADLPTEPKIGPPPLISSN